jgi:hypothetical protein
MLFRLGPPPNALSDSELACGEWQRIPRLPLWATQIVSPLIGAFIAFLVFTAWALLTPRFQVSFAEGDQVAVAFALVMLAGMVLQMTAYPRMGLSDQSVLGLWPSRLTPYTAHLSKITKRRLVAISLVPFLVLAILPLLVAVALRVSSGWLIFGSCLAAVLFGPTVVLALPTWRLPKNSIVAGRGFQGYWRLPQ